MAFDHALHRREPDARALELGRIRQSRERAEQQVVLLHVEADAVVADKQRATVGALHRSDLDARGGRACRVLQRVADEVRERGAKQRRIDVQS